MREMLVVFCPFAAGYFLSFFFRNVNAIIASDLTGELQLSSSELGLLTSMYLLAFALFQLPVGLLLDRYGPRRVVGTLMCVAGLGALIFAQAEGLAMLAVGRALIGLGVSAGLMGAIKAFTLWFPLSRLASLNGLFLAAGGLGGLSATAPAEALLGELGWRALFMGLAGASILAAAVILFVVPEKKLPGQGATLRHQIAGFRTIFRSTEFWRVALPLVTSQGIYYALQGLWLGPWLRDVPGLDRSASATYLLITASAYALGSVFFGVASDRLAAAGISRMAIYKVGMVGALLTFCVLAAGTTRGLAYVLPAFGFMAISASLAYSLLTMIFPAEMTGRVNTAANVLLFVSSFAFQWSIGAILDAYPSGEGRYGNDGYLAAFGILAVLQAAALCWLLPIRGPTLRSGEASAEARS